MLVRMALKTIIGGSLESSLRKKDCRLKVAKKLTRMTGRPKAKPPATQARSVCADDEEVLRSGEGMKSLLIHPSALSQHSWPSSPFISNVKHDTCDTHHDERLDYRVPRPLA
ncbi:hypothetical protein D3C85_1406670 [compost metagenome]